MKRTILLLVLVSMLFECFSGLCTVSAKDGFCIYHEDFNEYATNEKPDGVLGSEDTRVVLDEKNPKNKVLYLSGKDTIASYTINGEFEAEFTVEMTVSRLTGKTYGDFLSVGSESAVLKLLTIDKEGTVLCDGRPIRGLLLNKKTKLLAKINLGKQTYSLYADNRQLAKNYKFYTKIDKATIIKTQVLSSDGEESGVTIDDVNVSSGDSIVKDYEPSSFNEEELEWPSDVIEESIPFEKIYLEDFESYKTGSSVIKETTVSQKNENNNNFIKVEEKDNNKYLHYYRHTTDPLLDFFTTSNANDLVAEAALLPNAITGTSRFTLSFIGKNAVGSFKCFDINSAGQVSLTDGTVIGTVNMKQWNKLTFIFRQDKREYDIYINNKMLASGIKFANASFPYLEKIRFSATGSGEVDFCTDMVAVYKGNKSIDDLGQYIKEMYDSYLYPSESEVLSQSDEKIVFSTNETVSKAIVDKNLIMLNKKPVKQNGKNYLPDELINYAGFEIMGEVASLDDIKVSGTTINNSVYFDATEIAKALNSGLFIDNSGFGAIGTDADSYYADWKKYWEKKLLIQYETPTDAQIYDKFIKNTDLNQHPRLVINADDVGRLRGEMEFDPVKQQMFEKLLVKANSDLNLELPKQVLGDGIRLAIHDYRHPVIRMAFAYLMTGDMKYAQKVKDIVLTEASFTNWNPSIHYLDTGVAGTTVAIGYDWLYDLYTPSERSIIEAGLTRNMLDASYSGLYNGEYGNFPRKAGAEGPAGNWHAICMSGTILSALAIMETNPEYCSKIVEGALRNFQYMLPSFEPDGAWEEGLGYWGYTNEFYCYIIESLKTSCGTDFGFYDVPGVLHTAYFPYEIVGPMGALNFGDADENGASDANFAVSWHGYVQNNPDFYSLRYKEILSGVDPWTIDLLYLDSEKCNVETKLPLDGYYGGIKSGGMRSEFNNVAATYVGYHCGNNTAGHNHYETGEFIFDALGVRWALDLGKDDYNLYTYNLHQDTAVYRRRTEGHNCFVINPNEYVGQAEYNSHDDVIRKDSNENSAFVIMDLSETYGENATKAQRGLKLSDVRNTLQIRDEIDLKKDNSDFYWFMHTRADVEINGNVAYLRQNGKKIKFEFSSNQPLTLGVMDAKPLPTSPIQEGQDQNVGVRKLVISGKASGHLVVNVKISPEIQGVDFGGVSDIPLDAWILDAPMDNIEKPLLTDLRVDGKTISGFNPERKNYNLLSISAKENIDIEAFCDERYAAEISSSQDGDNINYQVLLYDKNNRQIFTTYIVVCKRIDNSNIRSGETFVMPTRYWASAEPQSANNVNNILDGDLSTRWSAQGENYVIYELENTESISAVDIAIHQGDARNQFFSLQVSEDGKNYTTVYDNIKSSGTTNLPERYELNGINAKFVKLICYKTTLGDWNSVTEMYVYSR